MKVALYARVSTQDQDERLQLPRLRESAAARGWEVAGEYTDEASGRDANRPGWAELKKAAGRRAFGAVMVVKLDRMMRSLKGFLTELEDFRALGVRVVSLDYGDLDPRDPTGQLVIRLMASLAEWERDIISERTRSALEAKRAQGVRLGRPEKALPVQKIALMRSQGMSWSEISKRTGIPRSTIMGRKAEIEVRRAGLGDAGKHDRRTPPRTAAYSGCPPSHKSFSSDVKDAGLRIPVDVSSALCPPFGCVGFFDGPSDRDALAHAFLGLRRRYG